MSNQVLGRNVQVKLLIGVDYYPIFCGKTAELTLNQDEVEVTHVNSGISREYVPGMSNSTVSITGMTVSDNTEGRIAWTYLAQAAIRRSINTWRIEITDNNAVLSTITFDAFWTSGTLSREITAFSQSNCSLRVTGGLSFSSPVTPPDPPACQIEDTLYFDLAEGAVSVISASLVPGVGETITILQVTREGSTYYETTGTPGSLEFKYTSGTGTITFSSLLPGNPAAPVLERVSVEYKIET